MKIKLKTFGLPSYTGKLYRVSDDSDSGTGYSSSYIGIKNVFIRDKTGDLNIMEAGQGIGFLKQLIIPYSAFDSSVKIDLLMTDRIETNGILYEIRDIQIKEQGHIEDHYKLNVIQKNGD